MDYDEFLKRAKMAATRGDSHIDLTRDEYLLLKADRDTANVLAVWQDGKETLLGYDIRVSDLPSP